MTTSGSADASLLQSLQAAQAAGKLTASAVTNIRQWLTEPRYARYAGEVAEHIRSEKWKQLDDAFWTVIPFGTGGRRGRMYPIGSNAINDRTIGESAQGLADYIRELEAKQPSGKPLCCAIAYDTRHRSRHFAELCASIMAANGFTVYFLDDYRSTPELSFLVRWKDCSCGIMVTASHNPPSDNAVKVYASTGGQLLPPHDDGVINRVMSVDQIREQPFAEALAAGKIVICTREADAAYLAEVKAQASPGPRNVRIVYSPLHGVGGASVPAVLTAAGFQDVTLFPLHAQPSGDFPNVPGHVSNPENPRVFDAIIERARADGADLVLATDPDCDRMGCAAPVTLDPSGPWRTFTGNQLCGLLADFVLERAKSRQGLTKDHFVVTTLVTTRLVRRIAEAHGVRAIDELLVGFKYIGGAMDEHGADKFLYGCEESHGFLVGQYARDKDGAVACLLMAELAAHVKAARQSLHEWLEAIYWRFGYHDERLINVQMEGASGMARMQTLMERLRNDPPQALAGRKVTAVRDYRTNTLRRSGAKPEPLAGPTGDLVMIEFDEGNYIAVRPSGTEPKIKFYLFAHTPAELLADLETTRQQTADQLGQIEAAVRKLASEVE